MRIPIWNFRVHAPLLPRHNGNQFVKCHISARRRTPVFGRQSAEKIANKTEPAATLGGARALTLGTKINYRIILIVCIFPLRECRTAF